MAIASTYSSRLDYTDLTSNLLGAVGQGGAATSPGAAGAAGVGGGIWTKGDVTIFTSIVRGNTSAECAREGNPTITSGSSLQTIGPDDATCPGRALDPGLGPLLDNGGPVPTRAPSATGSAVGIVTQCGTGVKDARGVTGPAPCEPGAYQIVPPAATTGDASDATVSATVNTNGPAGTAHFDYGTSDAYGSSTADQAVDPGLADRAVSAALSGLPVGATIHYRVVVTTQDGTSAGADRTFATPAPPPQQQPAGGGTPPPPKDTVAPSLRSLKLSAKKFKAGKKVTISFASSEPGGYKLAFEQVLAGKKVRKKGKTTCVKAHGKVPKKSRCSYYKSYGSMAGNTKAGSNAVAFAGKVGKKELAAGSYRLTLVETDAAGNKSEAVSAKFAIVK